LETLFKSHPDLLKLVGREATLRLIKELPPILLAPDAARQKAAKSQWAGIIAKPFAGVSVQPEVWKNDVIRGYVQAALQGNALRQTATSLQPLKLSETEYLRSLLAMLDGQPKVKGKSKAKGAVGTDG
jgi:hypothetical protein